jgi:hypothetical protein
MKCNSVLTIQTYIIQNCYRLSSQYRLILYKTVTDSPHNTDLYYTKLLQTVLTIQTHIIQNCYRLSSQYRLILYKTVTDCPHNTDLYYTKLLQIVLTIQTHYCTHNTDLYYTKLLQTVLTIQTYIIQNCYRLSSQYRLILYKTVTDCPHNTDSLLYSQNTWYCPYNTDLEYRLIIVLTIQTYIIQNCYRLSSQYRLITVLTIQT